MDTAALATILPFIAVVIVSTLTARFVRKGTLSRNRSIGIKTRNTLASDEAWKAGHMAALPWLRTITISSTTTIVFILLLMVLSDGQPNEDAIAVFVGLGLLSVIGFGIVMGRVANRAAGERLGRSQRK